MKNNIIVAGIDGGGTNTRAVLMNELGEILGTGQSGSSSIDTVTLKETEENIMIALNSAWINSKIIKKKLDYIVIGLGGVSTKSDIEIIKKLFSKDNLIENNKIYIVNDAEIALYGGLSGEAGIILISGTGSVCYGKNKNEITFRSGGWGYIADDEGSGYYFGLKGISHMLKCFDGRKEEDLLSRRIKEYLNENDEFIINKMLYEKKLNRTEIAQLSKVVIECANEGEISAIEILNNGIDGLINMVKAVNNKIRIGNEIIKIVKVGGIFDSNVFNDIFNEKLLNNIHDVEIAELEHSPVVGAALMALKYSKINERNYNV